MRSISFCLVALIAGAHGFVAPSKLSLSTQKTSLHLMDPMQSVDLLSSSLSIADDVVGEAVSTYSKASYYTVLGLYVMSFPGIWSQVKRSTSAKIKRKTYTSPGEKAVSEGKDLRQQAGEIMACKCWCTF